jgi:pimeloyl-ACP methyl ester carboxylesterase
VSTWVLLRGLMREQRHWGQFRHQLAVALPDADIATPDLPGNGERHALRSCTTVAEMVEFCRQDLLARGWQPPYHLLALSLGGMVAAEWAHRYPGEIAGCVLVNTSMRPYSPFHLRLRWQNYGAILRQLLRRGAARQEALVLRLTSNAARTAEQRRALLLRWTSYQRDYPVSRANALRQLLSAARYHAPSTRPPVPLLVLCSAGDRLVDHRCSLRLAEAWQAPLQVHAGAGHDLPLDDGAWVAHAVKSWLDQT